LYKNSTSCIYNSCHFKPSSLPPYTFDQPQELELTTPVGNFGMPPSPKYFYRDCAVFERELGLFQKQSIISGIMESSEPNKFSVTHNLEDIRKLQQQVVYVMIRLTFSVGR
jgi:hypothetical protein